MIPFPRGSNAPRRGRWRSYLAFVIACVALLAAVPAKVRAADDTGPTEQAVLLEEDPGNPAGHRFPGSVVWHADKLAGQPDGVAVRAEVDIPNKFKMTLTLRRNIDNTLPASHVVEVIFRPAPGYEGRSIASVPGMLAKLNEQARGVPFASIAVKVNDNFFLIGMSNIEADRQRNLQSLRDRWWFDIPVVDARQRRSIIAIEKGLSGQRALVAALTAWGQN